MIYESKGLNTFYFECRMENRDQASQEKDVEWIVVDECDEEASDAPSAPAGISFIQFYYSIDE